LGAHQLQEKVIEHAGHSINLAKVKGKKKIQLIRRIANFRGTLWFANDGQREYHLRKKEWSSNLL
jgi:hypothetical protein